MIYARRKAGLLKEKARLEEILSDTGDRVEKWLDAAEKTFDFACYAKKWFANGSAQEKGSILQALGSNLTLKDKILHIQLKKPFVFIERVSSGVPEVRAGFEPKKIGQNERKLEQFYCQSPILRSIVDDVRTYFMGIKEYFEVPVLGYPQD